MNAEQCQELSEKSDQIDKKLSFYFLKLVDAKTH